MQNYESWIYILNQIVESVPTQQVNISTLIYTAGPVVKFVLVILLLMSFISWMIVFSKYLMIKSARNKSEKFLDLYHTSGNFGNLFTSTKHIGGPVAEMFRAGYTELLKIKNSKTQGINQDSNSMQADNLSPDLDNIVIIDRVIKKTMSSEISKLEGSLTFLATTGSTAPFIGLFGTVWGIMNSFIGLASSQDVSTLQAVAPGIAEALIATAVGLAAAIPAVVAYNYFISKVRVISIEMDNFLAEFLNVAERYISKL
ncbi:MAG: protein TolQ [Deltaproteobacteria bacterium]|nr:MAG: protein TolQ [Deltaproteobacteria bacterium]TDJ05142.1 MAG: protein TolQ [Deltaproteobacteria bacterium]